MKKTVLCLCVWGWATTTAVATERWSFEAYLGDAHNFRSRLKIEQNGGFSRSLTAEIKVSNVAVHGLAGIGFEF